MKNRIISNKQTLANHILNMEEGSLARQVLTAQVSHNLPGLKNEAEQYIEDLGLPNCLTNKITETSWKLKVKRAVGVQNEKEIRQKMESYKKVKHDVSNVFFWM